MKLTIEMLEEDIDNLLEKINDANLSKYDKYELCQQYLLLEDMSDDVYDSLNGKKSERYDNCIAKMRILNGHFYHSQYSKDYDDIFDAIIEIDNNDIESETRESLNEWKSIMFPNTEDGEDPFDSYDWDD